MVHSGTHSSRQVRGPCLSLAQWLVVRAEDLDIQYVIFDDQFWSARISPGQWHDYDASDSGNEILRHLDHVHVVVLRGGAG